MNEKRMTPSLAEVAVTNLRRSGVSTARAAVISAQACSVLWAWAKTTRELGHPPTRTEHAHFWKQSERQVYKELERFRRAFPAEDGPQRLADWLNEVYAGRVARLNEGSAMSAPAPKWLAAA